MNNMINEQVLSVDSNEISEVPPVVSILVVDCDSACLAIVSRMLHVSGYKVVTAKRATDALHILRERQDELDLVLTEAHLPDMDKYELLETIGEMSCLPVVFLSADNNENAMLGCLFKGATFYLLKPITMNDVKNMWQFSCMKKRKRKENVATEGSQRYQCRSPPPPEIASNIETSESLLVLDTCKQNVHKGRGKKRQEVDKDEEDNVSSTVAKKPKLIWTNELHDRFLQAIRMLGIDGAHPTKILKHMNVPGLKKENISSHLQKYRLSLKREQEAIQKTMFRDDYLSPWNLERESCCEFLMMTGNQPEYFSSYYVENQNYFNDSTMTMTMPNSLGCTANFPVDVQLSSQSDQMINYAYTSNSEAGIWINSNEEEESCFDETRNVNMEMEQLTMEIENSEFEILSDGIYSLENSSHQQQQQQEGEYMLSPLSPLLMVWEDQGKEDDDDEEIFDTVTFSSEIF